MKGISRLPARGSSQESDIKLSLLLPSLYRPLAERAIASFNQTGDRQGCQIEIVVVSPSKPTGDNVVWIEETKPQGCYIATKKAFDASTGDVCLWTCDDVVYANNWFSEMVSMYTLMRETMSKPFILGLMHDYWPGTCFGRHYAQFPMFDRELANHPLFCPDWLKGQWGDVVFGMSVWMRGGIIVSNKKPMAFWTDRLGCGESSYKHGFETSDRQQVIKHLVDLGVDWPTGYMRGFNIDAPLGLLTKGPFVGTGTIYEPNFHNFMEMIRYADTGTVWRCNHCGTQAVDRLSMKSQCVLMCELRQDPSKPQTRKHLPLL